MLKYGGGSIMLWGCSAQGDFFQTISACRCSELEEIPPIIPQAVTGGSLTVPTPKRGWHNFVCTRLDLIVWGQRIKRAEYKSTSHFRVFICPEILISMEHFDIYAHYCRLQGSATRGSGATTGTMELLIIYFLI